MRPSVHPGTGAHKSPADSGSDRAIVGASTGGIVCAVTRENPIGEYLRARRQLVSPDDVGFSRLDSRRRVTGLRRAEVAMLAGVSTEYYIRLEQGRDQHPSQQVLDALARAL